MCMAGNPTPRVRRLYGGMLNAIGLQKSGYRRFSWSGISLFCRKINTKIIVNVCGKTVEDSGGGERLEDSRSNIAGDQCFLSECERGAIAFGQRNGTACMT